jgi:protein required for attachment to host cells
MANEETSKERAASDFSREVAAAIRKRRVDGEAHRVVLMAEPGFLGLLRGALDGPTKKIVDAEVPKEVTGRKVEEIAGYLEGIVRVGSGRG